MRATQCYSIVARNRCTKRLDAEVQVGRTCGLELNLGKTVVLQIRGDVDIIGPNGNPLKVKGTCIYLDGLLNVDDRPAAKLTRRLAEARHTFQNIVAIWRHAKISQARTRCILDACVISKLLYGLEST